MGEVLQFPARFEARLTKSQLAGALGVSISWVDKRVADGMPSHKLGPGRNAPIRFLFTEVDVWLKERSCKYAS